MKSKLLFSAVFVLLFTLLYVPVSYSQNPTFNFVLTNDSWDGHMVFEADVIVLSTGAAPIELAAISMGFTINNSALNGGTLSAAFVPGSSELTNTAQINYAAFNTTGTIGTGATMLRIIKAAGKTPPGAGNGSLISNVAPGTKIGRLRLTNTVDFIIADPNSIDTVYRGTGGYAWSLNAYVGTTNTNITNSGTYIKILTSPLLPVELTSFISNVNGRQVNLSWETKTEVNARQFEIERSIVKDATTTWTSVGIVQAEGTSTITRKYSFTDKNLQAGKYQYRIKMIDNDGSFKLSDVVETEIALPKNFELSQNYPNPFNPSTRINYSIPFDSRVTLDVYNITGERMGQIVNQEQTAGYYTVNFSSSALNRSIASGVYIYKISAVDNSTGNVFTSIKKMMLLK
jgi:hypothetical protein